MDQIEKFGTQSANICIGAVVCCFDVVAGGAMTATGLAALAFMGARKRGWLPDRTAATVSESAVAALRTSPEFGRIDVARLQTLLADTSTILPPGDLRDIARRTQPEAIAGALAGWLGRAIPYDGDDDVTRNAMAKVLVATMRAVCETDAFRTRLTELRGADTHVTLHEMKDSLRDLKHATRDHLEALAARFRIPDAFDLSDGRLRAELHDRAREYEALRKQVAALDSRTAGIVNLKAAATDALDRLDFAEAAALFARIRATQTHLANETGQAEADTLLMLDKVEAARDVLLDMADGYRRRDREEYLRLTNNAADHLYEHGLKRSGPAMDFAASIWAGLLQLLHLEKGSVRWGLAHNNLGIALLALGQRGNSNALRSSIMHFRAAFTVRNREDMPMEWAQTQINLGSALRTIGEQGSVRALLDAVSAYRASLEVISRETAPVDWADAQNNLGNALQALAAHGEETALTQAIVAIKAAIKVYTQEDLPIARAKAQINFGNALSSVGRNGDSSALRSAVSAYRAALEVLTYETSPLAWAVTQHNLGSALSDLGDRGDKVAAVEAVAAFHAALEIRTREELPHDWASTLGNLARAFLTLAAAEPDHAAEHLARALDAIDEVLEIYTPEYIPMYYEGASTLRTRILAAQAET